MRVVAIALACFFVTVAGQSVARSAELSNIKAEQLASILKKDGRNPTIEQGEGGTKFVRYDLKGPWNPGAHGVAQIFDNNGFRLFLGFRDVPGADLAKINEINWNWLYCHAHLDEGAVYVIRDVFVPGITESSITGNVKLFDDISAEIFNELQ